MLSRITLICPLPTSWRMADSTCAKYCCVVSSRVPGGARTCRRIWPASTSGKKSRPSSGNSGSDSAMIARNASTVTFGCDSAQATALR